MATVSLVIAGKRYDVGCEAGAEARLRTLAGIVDSRAQRIAAEGATGEVRLVLLSALVLADELSNALARAGSAETRSARLESRLAGLETRAATIIEGAARRLEAIGADWE